MVVGQKTRTAAGPEKGPTVSQDHLVDPLTQPSGIPAGAVAWTGGNADMPEGGGSSAPTEMATITDAQNDEQVRVVSAAVHGAREMAALAQGIAGSAGSDEHAAAKVAGSFHDSSTTTLSAVNSALSQTATGLNSAFNIQVETWMWPGFGGDTAGYVYGGPVAGFSDIHLTPKFFEMTTKKQAGTIFHEGTHKWAGTVDKAYMHDSAFSSLSPADAVKNADSYNHLGLGLLTEKRDAEREADRAEQLRIATSMGGELIQATLDGSFEGRSDSTFTTEDGVVLEYLSVYQGMQAYIQAQHPEIAAEIAAKMEDPEFNSYANYTSTAGVVVPYLLVNDLGMAGGFEGW